mmetsp:Transcript_122277/g.182732  ORF Transcript_122277/g.182732 Transcript_122277/m.182732 type:complete len:364 (-) Transcript_122277:10-1101(-)|eukprot:CAMPEP_0117037582 /NCGR_PEP_ID=MMETSP0472-20121206/26509_1 /TAXON_ID=693140 ORGANISM="Tiarina fusus, Strain LIS" /NCGR_SAMPLE_ID=MMETSP0472 /ASSEMBLY_ACC=CAM_ASM_000603 /LENGTH=363 /DNA_ID=CAMNT_0004747589 /DNA_START=191 /DNA_END=1282 /DNA_ORIENTATION=-
MGLIGSIMALPFLLLWYAAWFTASVFRPLLLATIICMATNTKAAKEKVALIVTTFQFLFLCKDKKWKKAETDPASYFTDLQSPDIEKKTVIFIRHGESTWNDTFNKGDRKMGQFLIGFFPNLFKSFATEWYFLVSGKSSESWFFDSPLSEKGISQAQGLQKFLRDTKTEFIPPKEAKFIKLLKGEEKSQMMSSNLRRAISTISIGLQDRLDKRAKDDKILILSELQEMSVNPDALSIHPPKKALVTSWIDSERVKDIYANQCDTALNTGNKTLKSNGLQRMEGFNSIVFDNIHADAVIATGHSYWFRAFFQTYLPWTFEHVSKKKKLINGGSVGFTLMRTKTPKGDYAYMIDSSSLVTLYGGF